LSVAAPQVILNVVPEILLATIFEGTVGASVSCKVEAFTTGRFADLLLTISFAFIVNHWFVFVFNP